MVRREEDTRKMRRKRFLKKEMDEGAWFPDDPQECKRLGLGVGWGGGMFVVGKKKLCALRSERFAHLPAYSIPVCSADY